MKRQLMAGVEHFNRDWKKGFEYLRTLHLLPPEDDDAAVAQFFRSCPGLDKDLVGEYLGDSKEFKVPPPRRDSVAGTIPNWAKGSAEQGDPTRISMARIAEY